MVDEKVSIVVCSSSPGYRRGLVEIVAAAVETARKDTAHSVSSAHILNGVIGEVTDWDAFDWKLPHESRHDIAQGRLLILDADPWDEIHLNHVAALNPLESRVMVVMLSTSKEAEHAIAAVGYGCWEYLIKPVDRAQLTQVLTEAVRIIAQSGHSHKPHPTATGSNDTDRTTLLELKSLQADEHSELQHRTRLIGQSPAMMRVYKQIGQAAPSDVSVLVTGESGTGKELVCCAIHDNSGRCDGPFVAINCAAIPDTLLESELFGHERGAFTGADRKRIGKFEAANHGTVMLDEIGDMSPTLQAKLLRLVQDRTFYRVGGNQLLEADVRIVAATNQPLEHLVSTGAFRADLFYRLRVVHIELEPLRNRQADIVLLAHHFSAMYNQELNRSINNFHPESIRQLLLHDWPGNIRELQNVIKQAMLVSHGSVLVPDFLPTLVRKKNTLGITPIDPHTVALPTSQPYPGSTAQSSSFSPQSSPLQPANGGGISADSADLNSTITQARATWTQLARLMLELNPTDAYEATRIEVDAILIEEALRRHHGNISAAARHLGITRTTLRKRLQQGK